MNSTRVPPWVMGWAVCGVACLVLATGCSDSTEPRREVWNGPETFVCAAWAPERPAAEWVMLDIVLQAETEGAPDSTSLATVVGAGGELVHVFGVPMARFIVKASGVEGLYPEPVVEARGVPDPTDLTVTVVIKYSRAVLESDLAVLESLGAHDMSIMISKYVRCAVTDGSIGDIRALPDVVLVGLDYAVCLN